MIKLLNFLAVFLYMAGGSLQWQYLKGKTPFWLISTLIVAIIFHGYLLYHWIDIEAGQNLTFANLLSLVMWVCSLVILSARFYHPMRHLGLILFPISAGSIIFATFFPANHVIETASLPRELIHILLSVITFSVFIGAAMQAIVLAIQEKYLRRKNNVALLQKLPPLETMEELLFKFIFIGVLLLFMMTITSILFFYDLLLNQLLQKTILTFLSLIVFITLLIGRHYYGWRGKKAVSYTLAGFILVTLTYFCSLFITGLL